MTDHTREPLSKKLRFEVFKRDKFTCQYCGEKAPDVILQCDHIQPVAEGGKTEIMNLITACQSCNSGKGARLLSDDSIVERQRAQIEELEERRQQSEMMLEWRDGLSSLEEEKVCHIADRIEAKSNFGVNENGKQTIRRWMAKLSISEILDAVDASFGQYLVFHNDLATSDSWNIAFSKVPAVAAVQKRSADKPYLKDLYYTQAICRSRFRIKFYKCVDFLEEAYLAGVPVRGLMIAAKEAEDEADFELCVSNLARRARGAGQ